MQVRLPLGWQERAAKKTKTDELVGKQGTLHWPPMDDVVRTDGPVLNTDVVEEFIKQLPQASLRIVVQVDKMFEATTRPYRFHAQVWVGERPPEHIAMHARRITLQGAMKTSLRTSGVIDGLRRLEELVIRIVRCHCCVDLLADLSLPALQSVTLKGGPVCPPHLSVVLQTLGKLVRHAELRVVVEVSELAVRMHVVPRSQEPSLQAHSLKLTNFWRGKAETRRPLDGAATECLTFVVAALGLKQTQNLCLLAMNDLFAVPILVGAAANLVKLEVMLFQIGTAFCHSDCDII
ncbi:hypothetical protein C8R43DRAFT_1124756 [Mycena crocata]|nr:hypothetical protein C8R43DRAFT_1124756 [Mycena crocata]